MEARLSRREPIESTGSRYRLPVFCVWLLLGLPLAVHADVQEDPRLTEVRALANSGAAVLAIQLLDDLQPDIPTQRAEWMALERERIRIYQTSRQWDRLAERLTYVPRNMPAEFTRWAMTERAHAFLNLGKETEALAVLRELLWFAPVDDPELEPWRQRWRELVMTSYINLGLAEDAYSASMLFYEDYPAEELQARLLQARIFLLAGHPDRVFEVIEGDNTDPAAGVLYLLAQLRSDGRPARTVMQAGLRHLRGAGVNAELKPQLWAVVAEAAQRSGDRITLANALEHVLAAGPADTLPPGLFKFDADSLWNAYIDLATFLGNQKQFLIGNDAQWFGAAQEAGSKLPVQARAYYALLMLKGQDQAGRERAADEFIALLRKRSQGANLMDSLFLASKQFKSLDSMPQAARLELADIALARNDIQRASELLATIHEAPAGTDAFAWQLRRARIMVLGGDTSGGGEAMLLLLQSHETLDERQQDLVRQVVFDLQTANAHQPALVLFEKLLEFTDDITAQRELYYWMAESRLGLQDYSEAARLYLKSAMLIGEDAMDPWAQTARYHAASALAKAGLLHDARALFSHLLRVTKETNRRAVLQHELQKLWLLEDRHSEVTDYGG